MLREEVDDLCTWHAGHAVVAFSAGQHALVVHTTALAAALIAAHCIWAGGTVFIPCSIVDVCVCVARGTEQLPVDLAAGQAARQEHNCTLRPRAKFGERSAHVRQLLR